MSDEDALRVKEYWDTAYSGTNSGKVAVIGADMKFTSFAMKGADSQLVEQMRYSDEQICQPFGIPPFKVGIGSIPAGLSVDSINLMYYDGALSTHIEAMENLLDEGLGLGVSGDTANLGIWMDLDPLLRMDVGKQAEVEAALVGGKIKTPDEARKRFNLAPTGGGDTLWGQDQDKPLGVLSDPKYIASVMGTGNQAPTPAPPEDDTQRAMITASMTAALWKKSPESYANAV
jgi:HK97 family phage portal protein